MSDLADELRAVGLIAQTPDSMPRTRLTTADLTAPERELASALLADPMRPDDAAFALGMDLVAVARMLTALEQCGAVRRYPDGRYGPAREP